MPVFAVTTAKGSNWDHARGGAQRFWTSTPPSPTGLSVRGSSLSAARSTASMTRTSPSSPSRPPTRTRCSRSSTLTRGRCTRCSASRTCAAGPCGSIAGDIRQLRQILREEPHGDHDCRRVGPPRAGAGRRVPAVLAHQPAVGRSAARGGSPPGAGRLSRHVDQRGGRRQGRPCATGRAARGHRADGVRHQHRQHLGAGAADRARRGRAAVPGLS